MDERQHPLTSPFLFIQLLPQNAHARPTVQQVVSALTHCMPFRFVDYNDQQIDSTAGQPLLQKIEFQKIENAHLAYATVQNVPLPLSNQGPDIVQLSLSIHLDPAQDPTPQEASLVNISELPVTHRSAEAVYTLFKQFGPIYRLQMIAGPRPVPGTAQVIYYNQTSAQKAEECLNYTELDGMSIIVRRPTIHDVKDTFRNPYSFLLGNPKSDQDGNEDNEDSELQEAFSDQADTVISTPSALKREKKEHTVGTYADGALKKKVFTGYYHPQYADKRATCGFGYKPYGLSAAAEAFEPRKSPVPRSASSASSSKYAPPQVYHKANPSLQLRSISQPILLTDPTRLIIQNIPLEMKTQEVFIAIREILLSNPSTSGITLHETSLALDSATGESQGVAVIRVGDRKESTLALEVLNGNYLIGYGECDHVPDGEIRMPLKVKLFEPRGFIEKGLQFTEQAQKETDAPAGSDKVSEGTKGLNRVLTPISITKQNITPSEVPLPISPSARSSSTFSNTTSTMTKASIQSKHRKLLNTALEDLSPDITKQLFMNEEEKKQLLDALLECLSEEERKRCMFEEEYLAERCMALKELYFGKTKEGQGHVHEEGVVDGKRDDNGTAEDADRSFNAPESPSRVYDRKDLLKLYRPHSPTHEKTEAMIRAISPTTSIHSQPREITKSPKDTLQSKVPENPEMTIEELIKLNLKEIMDLASSRNPPSLLAERDKETVKEVNMFLESINGYKPPRQKQKIGEKVFKVFKNKAPGMKNISKRTIALLDSENLGALLHMAEEFPDILVAKALTVEIVD